MITSEVLTRVLLIRAGENTGTAFTYESKGRQYLITALHVVKGSAKIEVFRNSGWHAVAIRLVWQSDTADVAVFSPETPFPHPLPCPPFSTKGIVLGQQAFALGYPLTLKGGEMQGYPIPLVRRCCLSWIGHNATNDTLFILDGFATPGFSGGPLALRAAERSDAAFSIAGVVLGYWPEVLPVDLTFAKRKPDEKPTMTVSANSGLMVCADIEQVLRGIESVGV